MYICSFVICCSSITVQTQIISSASELGMLEDNHVAQERKPVEQLRGSRGKGRDPNMAARLADGG